MNDRDQEFMQVLRQFESSADATCSTESGSCSLQGGSGFATERPDEGGGQGVPGKWQTAAKGDGIMNSDREFMEALKAFDTDGDAASAAVSSGDFQSPGGGSGLEAAQAMGGTDDQEFFQALAAFGGPAAGGAAASGVSAQGLSLAQVCSTYKTVRPVLAGILPFIKVIPGIGTAVATALQALMAVLDTVCSGKGTLGQVCEIWKKVRPIVLKVISIVAKIPFIGSKAATALQALANVLNGLCP